MQSAPLAETYPKFDAKTSRYQLQPPTPLPEKAPGKPLTISVQNASHAIDAATHLTTTAQT